MMEDNQLQNTTTEKKFVRSMIVKSTDSNGRAKCNSEKAISDSGRPKSGSP